MPTDLSPMDGDPWRSMSAEGALAFLLAEDVARRTSAARDEAYGLRLGGIANRKRLVAWRRENGLCPKCGRAIPADKVEFKHCPSCRKAFREYQRHVNASLNETQRIARNERARKSYHKLTHGQPPPELVTRRRMVTPMVTVVTPDPMVTKSDNLTSSTARKTAAGPKRDRAEYMRDYRAAKAAQQAEPK